MVCNTGYISLLGVYVGLFEGSWNKCIFKELIKRNVTFFQYYTSRLQIISMIDHM